MFLGRDFDIQMKKEQDKLYVVDFVQLNLEIMIINSPLKHSSILMHFSPMSHHIFLMSKDKV